MIPETFLSAGISIAYIVTNNPVYHIDLGTLYDDETIIAGSKDEIYRLNKVNTTICYDHPLQAQIDSGAGVSVTNMISLFHNVKFFNAKFKSNVRIYGATSK